MPRLTEATKRRRREQIAAAALRCFARQGFADTSMADIIAESGLSAGSIYSHYDSKVELIRAVASDVLSGRAEAIAAGALDLYTPGQALMAFVEAVTLSELPQVLMQVWAEVPRDAELAEAARTNIGLLRGLMTRTLARWIDDTAERTGTPRAHIETRTIDAIMACAQGCMVRAALEPDVDIAAVAANLAAVLDAA